MKPQYCVSRLSATPARTEPHCHSTRPHRRQKTRSAALSTLLLDVVCNKHRSDQHVYAGDMPTAAHKALRVDIVAHNDQSRVSSSTEGSRMPSLCSRSMEPRYYYRGSIDLEHSDGMREPSHCGSIGLDHNDGVRGFSLDEDRLMGTVGEDDGRDLALLQRCRGSIVASLLVSTASVSALVAVGGGVAVSSGNAHCGSIGLDHNDGVRGFSLDEDRLMGTVGEDDGRDLALLQRCHGSIVASLLVSTASVSALVAVGGGVAVSSGNAHCGSIGLDHNDGVRGFSLDEDRLMGTVGEDDGRDLALLQRCHGSIVASLLVSTASVSALVAVGGGVAVSSGNAHCGSIGLDHNDGVRGFSLDEDRLMGTVGEDDGRDLALLQRCRGSIVASLLVSTASVSALVAVGGGVAVSSGNAYCGSIGLEHNDGVREPSLAEDGLVGKAGEDDGRDLALLQRCHGSIVASLLVSTASVSALVAVGNDVNKKRLCAAHCGSIGLDHNDGVRGFSLDEDRLMGTVGEDDGRDLALLQRCRGSIVASLLVSTASVSALVAVGGGVAVSSGNAYCGSIGLEHNDGVREPSLAEDGLVGKAGEDEGRDLALLQRCRGRIVEALLVSMASVLALVVVGNDVNKKRLCAALEHSAGVQEPSVDEDGLVGKAGEDEGRDLALLQPCRGSIVEALLVSTACVLALVVVGNDVNKKRLCFRLFGSGMQALAQEMKKRRVPADRLDDVVRALVIACRVPAADSASISVHPDAPAKSSVAIATITSFSPGPARDTSSLGAPPCSAKSGNQEIDAVSAATTSQISDDGFASDEDYTYDEGEEKEEEGGVHGVSAPSPARAPSPERARRTTSAPRLAIAPGPPRAGSPPGAPSPPRASSPPRAASAPTASSPPPGSPGETTDAESETDEDPPQVDEVPPEERAYPYVRVVGTERMADGEIRAWVEWEDTLEPLSALYPADARALARVLMNWPNTLEPLSNLVPADREQIERANGIAGN
ncbi:hypothetical protein PHYSODRAFT_329400 [Phytophthora sojae]|uniref:Uncharacterized protein n=1 Tax=Phytophthora sojae (strain P6497) TaxID=1094619 RepID=G4Z2M7_PHYSP|nr:hypothetical protein PHYSODRAFT_329400 [Phytophthora sojae]EGZ21456.1 hypothetical protein PHYSODRAFT_329400 [Phytophthora sojae]|eukprot:XP_009524173.1 hypothetical protein PHYSODRAFT_329400 [Phytophthora sojae]